ncbi:unnamed protein product, partial [Discosporangium mesarthrocarpum]
GGARGRERDLKIKLYFPRAQRTGGGGLPDKAPEEEGQGSKGLGSGLGRIRKRGEGHESSGMGDQAGIVDSGADEEARQMLEAFRRAGGGGIGEECLVRVLRLEGLSTATREFLALEGMPDVALANHILQATSNPRLEPLL